MNNRFSMATLAAFLTLSNQALSNTTGANSVSNQPALSTEQQLQALQQQIDALKLPVMASGTAQSNNNFNPNISLILAGGFTQSSQAADEFSFNGFDVSEEGGAADAGFSLGESELTFSANVDDQWYARLTVAFEHADDGNEVAVEEALIESQTLLPGVNVKLGRFLSGIGYLNNHHAHTDTFIDRPYVYRSFIDGGYGDTGIQLRYILPTDLFVQVGSEYLRGSGLPVSGAAHDGRGVMTAFVHLGGDINHSSSWLAGASYLDGRTVEGEDGFGGNINLAIIDATWKYSPNGNRKLGEAVVRGEYFLENRDGQFDDGSTTADWDSQRSGYYVQASYQYGNGWLMGARFDALNGDKNAPQGYASDASNEGISLITGKQHSEFSSLRAQLSLFENAQGDSEHSLTLQYMVALGAHGAHKF